MSDGGDRTYIKEFGGRSPEKRVLRRPTELEEH
jgi:hypothetical protein